MKIEWDMREFEAFGRELIRQTTFEEAVKKATQDLAKVLHQALKRNTPVMTGELKSGWDDSGNLAYRVTRVPDGFQVVLRNTVDYAYYVNYGHNSYNQYGGPYVVKRRTVKYTQGKSGKTFVYGHFFVENSITEMEATRQVEKAIMPHLQKWWKRCFK